MLDEVLSLVIRSRRALTLFLVFMRITMVGREGRDGRFSSSSLVGEVLSKGEEVGTYPRDCPL